MNIFYLSPDPQLAAHYLCDTHLNSMARETSQILSTAARHIWSEEAIREMILHKPYKSYNPNGRFVKWVLMSERNWRWLVNHGQAIALEYVRRMGKSHACAKMLIGYKYLDMGDLPEVLITPHARAFGKYHDLIDIKDTLTAYRYYYNAGKRHFATWKKHKPFWWLEDAEWADFQSALINKDSETADCYWDILADVQADYKIPHLHA